MPRIREVGRPLEVGSVCSTCVGAAVGRFNVGTVAECVRCCASESVSQRLFEEETMSCRRLVGIDLGIASAHAVRVLDEEGTTLVKRKAVPTVESLSVIESSALEGTPAGPLLEVVIEPTGPAWLPIAVFFINRGHVVYRVSSTESADLRRYLSRHAKTNAIDADTLARIPLFHPAGVQPLELSGADSASLDRRVRAAHRLTRQVALHKT